MAAVLPDDINGVGEFDRGGNVFTRVGAASVSTHCCSWCILLLYISLCLHIH